MFYLLSVALIAVAAGYIFNAMSIAIALIILFAIIGMPIIARMEARK